MEYWKWSCACHAMQTIAMFGVSFSRARQPACIEPFSVTCSKVIMESVLYLSSLQADLFKWSRVKMPVRKPLAGLVFGAFSGKPDGGCKSDESATIGIQDNVSLHMRMHAGCAWRATCSCQLLPVLVCMHAIVRMAPCAPHSTSRLGIQQNVALASLKSARGHTNEVTSQIDAPKAFLSHL